jgi:copper chaperone CopZ
MVCPACIITVKEVTGKIPGVLEADVSLASQDVIVKFRDKKTNAQAIESAIAGAGYPVKLDGTFTPPSQGQDKGVVASVNGQPLLSKDTELPVDPAPGQTAKPDIAATFFSVAGKEILLQIADKKQVIVQPYEVGEQIQAYMKEKGLSVEEMKAWSEKTYGSNEKYFQIVAQRIGIRKLLNEHILDGVKDPAEKKRKTMEWIGKVFKDADVKLLKQDYKQKLLASVGQTEWKVFWPLMIGKDTELKRLLVN